MYCISTKAGACLCLLLTGCAKHYNADGVVLQVNRPASTAVISHRAIPGYMQAMSMSFHAANPNELKALVPGSRVRFRLSVTRKHTSIGRIRVQSPVLADIALAPQAASLQVGDPAPDFTLTDQHGRAVSLRDLRGQYAAIDFIYTRCPLPDVCPRLSAHFALLQKKFPGRIALLSITIDPRHDTPEVLNAYAERWHAGPQWRFLTGSEADIRAVAGRFGMVYWPEDGSITHSATTVLISPRGRIQAVLTGSSHTAGQLVDLVRAALDSGL